MQPHEIRKATDSEICMLIKNLTGMIESDFLDLRDKLSNQANVTARLEVFINTLNKTAGNTCP